MKARFKQIARRQLDATLAKFNEAASVQPPDKGLDTGGARGFGYVGKAVGRATPGLSAPRL